MKINEKPVSLLILMVVILLFVINSIPVFAHETMLNVQYDDCVANDGISSSGYVDGINEMWYVLSDNTMSYHISDEESTIGYAFTDNPNTGESWDDVSEANEIKEAYVNSMKKWNNVYFYSHDSSGIITKKKIVNVVEKTDGSHILSIYPGVINSENIAETVAVEGYGTSQHAHYHRWQMGINISYFSTTSQLNIEIVNFARERTGAHELGHVLGLFDVDYQFYDGTRLCNSTEPNNHHHELLMGYGSPITSRSQDITYKDIAGVAITRGFHTDSDHEWLNAGLQDDGNYKLICSVCNGVKYDSNLNGYIYSTYGSCSNYHSISGGNMMAVASYGNVDYYKCRYCRYVAAFSDLVTQDYTISYYSETVHKYTNQIVGLGYTFYEDHSFEGGHICVECGYHTGQCTDHYEQYSVSQHKSYCECGEYILSNHSFSMGYCRFCGVQHTTHDYTDRYNNETRTMHRSYCICGANCLQPHVVESGSYSSGNKYALCLACKALVTIGMTHHQSITELPCTENGSFILPDGIIVLVDEDIEAYFSGTLEFVYSGDNSESA